MDIEIYEQLKEQFTLDTIDFYNDAKSVETFVYFANEVSAQRASELYSDYDKKYQNGEYDGSYEEYLKDNKVRYWIL